MPKITPRARKAPPVNEAKMRAMAEIRRHVLAAIPGADVSHGSGKVRAVAYEADRTLTASVRCDVEALTDATARTVAGYLVSELGGAARVPQR